LGAFSINPALAEDDAALFNGKEDDTPTTPAEKEEEEGRMPNVLNLLNSQ
jgi:hypothetical protein